MERLVWGKELLMVDGTEYPPPPHSHPDSTLRDGVPAAAARGAGGGGDGGAGGLAEDGVP